MSGPGGVRKLLEPSLVLVDWGRSRWLAITLFTNKVLIVFYKIWFNQIPGTTAISDLLLSLTCKATSILTCVAVDIFLCRRNTFTMSFPCDIFSHALIFL